MPGATVVGTAIDSLRAVAPLAGATVRVEGTTRLVTTDARGRFRLDSVPAGERTLVLDHPSLDSLGVGSVPRRLVLNDGDSVAVTLATPSAASVRAAACPGRKIDGRVLVGVVRDAATGQPLADVTVRAQWSAVGMGMGAGGRTSVAVRTPFVESYTGADGQYRLCDVDPDRTERVTVWATRGARATGALRLDAPRAPLEVLDLSLAVDSGDAVARRTGIVVGRVLDVGGAPYADAQLLVEGWDGVGRTDGSGRFRLDGVPAGTQAVRILRIGRAPLAHVLDVPPGRELVAEIRLRAAPSVLAPVVTRAEARTARVTEWVREVRPRSDVFFDSAAYHRARGAFVLDPVRARLTHPGVRLRDVPLPVLAAARGNCIPQVYADGLPVELADLRGFDPGTVETMAVFRQAAAAPPAEAPARRTIWVDTLTLAELPPNERPQSVVGTPIPRYGPDCGAVLVRTRRSFEGP